MMPRKGTNLSPEAARKNASANVAWKIKNTDNLSVSLRKGKRSAYRQLAAARGRSVSSMIQEYLDGEYEKEFGKRIQIQGPED